MKKNTITIICACIAVVAIGFSVLFYTNDKNSSAQMRHDSDRALSEFISSVSKIDTAITKSAYSTTPSYTVSMLAEVWKEAESAKVSLASLDGGEFDISQTQEFISKIGDYSLAMLRKTANGDALSSEEINHIMNFADQTEQLALDLGDIKKIYNDGEDDNYMLGISMLHDESVAVNQNSDENEIDAKNQEFATMIYDGPFSSHIDKLEPALTKNDKHLSEQEAKQSVASFLQVDESKIEFCGAVDGQIPFYKFRSEDISVDITQYGGHILNFINYRQVSDYKIDSNQALSIAKDMLASSGYLNFKETYYIDEGEKVTINFAFTQQDVILYPDLLKISIYKDDGTLASMESRGYIMSHTTREQITPDISIDTARDVVSKNLTIFDENIAIIPTSGKNEVLTYEFKCKNEQDKNFIVYVNAKTGQIENMLILIEDESGTLTM